jgi:hypothetical protein
MIMSRVLTTTMLRIQAIMTAIDVVVSTTETDSLKASDESSHPVRRSTRAIDNELGMDMSLDRLDALQGIPAERVVCQFNVWTTLPVFDGGRHLPVQDKPCEQNEGLIL